MKKHLLALAVFAAGALMALSSPAFAETPPTSPPSAAASTPAPAPTPAPTPAPSKPAVAVEKRTRVRVLADGPHGKANDLVELPPDVAKEAEAQGLVDSSKGAVAYAASLPQNRPKPQAEPDAE